jgi:Helix-turn-helix domain
MRMRQDPGAEPDAGDGGRFAPGFPVGADGDAPAWRDEQLGAIFRNMRLAMKVSRETIARRLATSTACIDSFEAGAVSALPHGKETERIVRGYCELLRVDPEPILWRIRAHVQALASQARAAVPTAPPQATSSTTSGRTTPRSRSVAQVERTQGQRTKARSPRRRRRARTLFALSAPVALAAALVYLAHAAPRPVYHAVALLPDPVESAVRAGLDYLVHLTAPRREGLRWIEVGDPRVRKADKLQTSTR